MIYKNKKKGWALVTILMISTLVLSVCALILSKTVLASKSMVKNDIDTKSESLNDAITSGVVGWFNDRSWDTANSNPYNLEQNGIDFIKELYNPNVNVNILPSSNDVNLKVSSSVIIDNSLVTNNNLDPAKNYYLDDFLNNTSSRTKNLLTTNSVSVMDSSVNTPTHDSSTAQDWKLNKLLNNVYRKFNIEYGESGEKIKAEARVSIMPLSTNIDGFSDKQMHDNAKITSGGEVYTRAQYIPTHEDIFKMSMTVCFPNCLKTSNIKKTEMLLSRPIVAKSDIPPFGVYADGPVDLQNATTSSGTTSTLNINDPIKGDVHSNDKVIIGATGHIGGKITSSSTVTLGSGNNAPVIPKNGIPTDPLTCASSAQMLALCTTTQIDNKSESKSYVDPIAKPVWDFSPYPSQLCSDTSGWTSIPKVIKDCRINGDYNIQNNDRFEGDVYITGDLKSSGSNGFAAQGEVPVHIIVDKKIDLGGSSTIKSTQEAIFVSNYSDPDTNCQNTNSGCQDAISISGNPGTGEQYGALFYTSSKYSNVSISGNVSFFGSVVASGTVKASGNATTIRRDTNMDNLASSLPINRRELIAKIISWKDVIVK